MLNLPIELIDKIVRNTKCVPILAYYIIRYKPSARFIVSIVGRPDFYLDHTGMTDDVYRFLTKKGFEMKPSLELFVEHAHPLLVRVIQPYYKALIKTYLNEEPYPIVRYCTIIDKRFGNILPPNMSEELKQEYRNNYKDPSYVKMSIKLFNTLNSKDIEWMLDNLIVGDEMYGSAREIKSSRLIMFKNFTSNTLDKCIAVLRCNVTVAHDYIKKAYSLLPVEFVEQEIHAPCFVVNQSEVEIVKELKELFPRWIFECSNIFMCIATQLYQTEPTLHADMVDRNELEDVEHVLPYIRYHTESLLKKLDVEELKYVIDHAFLVHPRCGLAIANTVREKLGEVLYNCYTNMYLYIQTRNVEHYKAMDLTYFYNDRIHNLFAKLGMKHCKKVVTCYDRTSKHRCDNAVAHIKSVADVQKAFDTYFMHNMAGITLFDMDNPYKVPVELVFDERSLRLGTGLMCGMDVISACCNKP